MAKLPKKRKNKPSGSEPINCTGRNHDIRNRKTSLTEKIFAGDVPLVQSKLGWLLYMGIIIVIIVIITRGYDKAQAERHTETIKATFEEYTSNIALVNMVYDKITNLFPPELGVTMGAVGRRLAEEGLKKKHPILLLPGFTTSGLEVWSGLECYDAPFRSRLWTSFAMIKNALLNSRCWIDHLKLDTYSNLDPPDIRVRPSEGTESASYFLPGFFVWGMIIENLAAIGYDSNSMLMAVNDWRLSFDNMERRDKFFQRTKAMVEYLHQSHQEKVVIVAHSMGAPLALFFLKWVEDPSGGNCSGWANEHVHAFTSIAGVYLGVPKAASALISGEMKDTSMLGEVGEVLESSFFSRNIRRDLFRTWHSLVALLPKGGSQVWGNDTSAPDDTTDLVQEGYTYGQLIQFQPQEGIQVPNNGSFSNFTNFIVDSDAEYRQVLDRVSDGILRDPLDPKYSDHKYWYNTLESPLPKAPNMKFYCLYGVGKQTERAYVYKSAGEENSQSVPYQMASGYSDNVVQNGVLFGEGDGTVPLISLGYPCIKMWKGVSPLNPSGIEVVTRELRHNPHPIYPRGGENSGDHVDIMGNVQINEDILRIAAGQELEENIISNIREYSHNIHKNIHG